MTQENLQKITVHERQINSQIILWTTIIGGFISSLVKWGSEVNMPPRMPGEISPPGANIDAWLGWLGFNSHSLDYIYQGVNVPGAVTLYHWLFSFVFAYVYVWGSIKWPRIRLWYGAFYGLIITVVMHGLLIPERCRAVERDPRPRLLVGLHRDLHDRRAGPLRPAHLRAVVPPLIRRARKRRQDRSLWRLG